MRKNILVALLLMCMLMLTSCNYTGKKEAEKGQVNQDIATKTIDTNSIASNNQKNENNYEIQKTSYVKNNIKIEYPQISGLRDTVRQKTINDVLKNDAMMLNIYGSEDDKVSLDIKYDVKWKGSNLLSVAYSGYGYVKGNAYPNNLFYTTNIDINKGDRLKLKDIVNMDKRFIEKFRGYKVKDPDVNQATAAAFKYIPQTHSVDDMLKHFKEADAEFGKSRYTFSYFTKDSIGVSLEVPHAVGDHIEIEVKYQDLVDYVKFENGIWNDFTGLLQPTVQKASVIYNDNLFSSDEEVLFSFKIKDTNKVLSVCISKEEPTYIVYRFGTKDNIELEFPQDKKDSWNKFTYSYYLRGGGKQNIGLDLNHLSFQNGNYTYEVYEEYSAEQEMTSVGVKVTEKSTKKEFDIIGIDSSRIGSLIGLRSNNKIKKE